MGRVFARFAASSLASVQQDAPVHRNHLDYFQSSSTVRIKGVFMSSLLKAINLGGVNCYLLAATDGYILIDTGFIGKRMQLDHSLEEAGCMPGRLKLILLTHGDSDHADNCAYLRNKYGCKIAMHSLDAGMVERGDMGWNRKAKADKYSLLFRLLGLIVKNFFGKDKFEKFTPDFLVDEDFDLSPFGIKARIIHMSGTFQGIDWASIR